MKIWFYTLASVTVISLVSFVGALLLGLNRRVMHGLSMYLVSLAIGGLLGGAFLHLIPVALERLDHSVVWLLVISGFFASFLLEKLFGTHSHVHEDSLPRPVPADRRSIPRPSRPLPMVGVVLMSDSVHNFLDGILIAGAFLVDPHLGLITSLIVLLHEIPQEFGDFGVLISGGLSIRRALTWNFITATTAIAGAVLALLIGSRMTDFADVIVPIAAGNFIYIAGADLIPHLHEKEEQASTAGIVGVALLGVLLMFWIHELRHSVLPH